jgi:hypothetical protein
MPPKHQNDHLKTARNSKTQKKIKKDQDFNIFNNRLDETFYDSETIIDSEDEFELSSESDSNNDTSEEVWYDETFESDLNSTLPSAFDKMINTSSSSSNSSSIRPSIYIGNSVRTMQNLEQQQLIPIPYSHFFQKKDFQIILMIHMK